MKMSRSFHYVHEATVVAFPLHSGNVAMPPIRGVLAGGLFVLALNAATAVAQDTPSSIPPDGKKPISQMSLEELMNVDVVSVNVLGTHVHLAKQWMISYEPTVMRMDGTREGTQSITTSEILTRYEMAPASMTTGMHMGMVMYAPSDDLTLSASVPYLRKRMTHITRDGMRMAEESRGFGDVAVGALYSVHSVRSYRHRFIINAGLTLPTGSVEAVDVAGEMPHDPGEPLDYTMQLGSGTVDVLPGVTYLGHTANWAFGSDVIPRIRLGTNSRGYRFGHQLRANAWAARRVTDWVSLSGRVDTNAVGAIHGADPALDPMMSPMSDPAIQGGKTVDAAVALEFYVPKGGLKGQRIAVEAWWPMYQSYDGPQLETSWQLRVGWQWVFYGPRRDTR